MLDVAVRLKPFEDWLRGLPNTPRYCYHVGDLARAAVEDPGVSALARRAREESNAEYVEVSPCGHPRGRTVGRGRVALMTRRVRGEIAYLAVRLCENPQGTAGAHASPKA